MFWFKNKVRKHPKKMHVPQLHFLGEQDGLPERDLKNSLREFFQRDRSVITAYLEPVRKEVVFLSRSGWAVTPAPSHHNIWTECGCVSG
jgi:hypothetical protein